MTIETEIAALTTATTTLLGAVNVAKSTLDTKVSDASASALAAQSAKVAAEATINVISFTAAENVTVDQVVIAGDLIGIAANTATTGQSLSVKRQGVFDMPKVAGEVFAVGGPVYWNKTTKVYTNVSAGNVLIGAATVAAIAGAARVNFVLQLNGARTVTAQTNPVTGRVELFSDGQPIGITKKSVSEFGAVADGVTNSTPAFLNALADGAPVYVPAGASFYLISALTNSQKALLYGPGSVYIGGSQYLIPSVQSGVVSLAQDTGIIQSFYGKTEVNYSGSVTGQVNGGNFDSYTSGSASYNTNTGVAGIAWHSGTGSAASLYGGRFQARNSGSGSVTDLIGVKINPGINSGGGSVLKNYGSFVNNSAIGSSVNSASHIYNMGLHGMRSWGADSNDPNAYTYLVSSGQLKTVGSMDFTGNVSAAGSVSAVNTIGASTVTSSGRQILFTIQNSKTITLRAGFGCLVSISFGGSGKAGLYWYTFDSAVITAIGPSTSAIELSATPSATALGLSKSAGSRDLIIRAGSGLLASQTNMSVSIIGSDILSFSDWT